MQQGEKIIQIAAIESILIALTNQGNIFVSTQTDVPTWGKLPLPDKDAKERPREKQVV